MHVLPKEDKQSALIISLLTEVVATSVFEPLMELISDPDFINQQIVNALKEEKDETKRRKAIEKAKNSSDVWMNSNQQIYIKGTHPSSSHTQASVLLSLTHTFRSRRS